MLNICDENFYLSGSKIKAGYGKLEVGGVGVEVVDHMPEFAGESSGLLLLFHSPPLLLQHLFLFFEFLVFL